MIERLIQDSRRGIRHAGDAQHANAAVPRGNYFGYGGHADEVSTDRAQVAYLGGGFVAPPGGDPRPPPRRPLASAALLASVDAGLLASGPRGPLPPRRPP